MYLHSILNKLSILSLGIVSLIFAAPSVSHAEEILTKEKIKAFYAQSVEVQLLGAGVTLEFLEEHVHEDSKTTLHMITNMQGVPPQKQTEIFDKRRLMKETKKGYELGNVEEMESNVISVDIASDGRSAKVKDSSYSLFSMTLPTPQGTISLHNEQSMLCDALVVLNSEDIIQAKGGVCNVEVNVVPAN